MGEPAGYGKGRKRDGRTGEGMGGAGLDVLAALNPAHFDCSLAGSFAIEGNRSLFLPRTPQEIEVRNRTLAAGERGGVRNDRARDVHSMLSLPDYSRWLRSPSSAPCG
jgi:hypothetical protein